jgi:N-acetylglucosamine-6-sulfatase
MLRPRRRTRRPSFVAAVVGLSTLTVTFAACTSTVPAQPSAAVTQSTNAVPTTDAPVHAPEPVRYQKTGERKVTKGLGGTYESPQHVEYRPTGSDDPRPNVVLITTDDQALTDLQWMPLTKKWLADEGITFENMISPHPLCCPARAEMMTGQYAQNNGVHTNAGPYGGLDALKDPDNTLAWWLQSQHYQTGMVGKYLNQYNVEVGVPRGWDHWNVVTHNGFGYYDYVLYNNGTPKHYGTTDAENSSAVIGADSNALIRTYAKDERPFFIWSSYYAPHGLCAENPGCDNPPDAETKYKDLYADVDSPHAAKPSFNEKNMSDKPKMVSRLPKYKKSEARYLFLQRIRALKTVDDAVNATMQTLKDTGELDNTLVLFTSDNGYLVGEHRFHGKIVPYEEALQVPLLMRGPGLPTGVTRTQPVTTVDLVPTILSATGVSAGRVQDGRNLLPFAKDANLVRGDDTALIQAGGMPRAKQVTPWLYKGVRTKRYTFVKWSDGFIELYDRAKDPYQLRNAAGKARYAKVEAELKHRTKVLRNCAGDQCRTEFGPVPKVLSK